MLPRTQSHRAPLFCAMVTAAALLAGCGGDSSAPDDRFPNAAGVYHIAGHVDGDPVVESYFGGIVTFTQASLTDGTLGGSGTVTGSFLAGLVVTVTDDALRASISPTGEITFTLTDASGLWSFSGTLSGNSLHDGRHLLRLPDGGEIPGDWSGSRTN
jgi:hypothetical protein